MRERKCAKKGGFMNNLATIHTHPCFRLYNECNCNNDKSADSCQRKQLQYNYWKWSLHVTLSHQNELLLENRNCWNMIFLNRTINHFLLLLCAKQMSGFLLLKRAKGNNGINRPRNWNANPDVFLVIYS